MFKLFMQGGDFFCLFKQNCKQDGLEGQQCIALADGGDVLACRREDSIEDVLVAASQGAPKRREHGFGFVEILRDGRDGASHGLEQTQLSWLCRDFLCGEDLICMLAESFQQKYFFFGDVRVEI